MEFANPSLKGSFFLLVSLKCILFIFMSASYFFEVSSSIACHIFFVGQLKIFTVRSFKLVSCTLVLCLSGLPVMFIYFWGNNWFMPYPRKRKELLGKSTSRPGSR